MMKLIIALMVILSVGCGRCHFSTSKSTTVSNYSKYAVQVTACDNEISSENKSEVIANDKNSYTLAVTLEEGSHSDEGDYPECSSHYPNTYLYYKHISISDLDLTKVIICKNNYDSSDWTGVFFIFDITETCPTGTYLYDSTLVKCQTNK